MTIDETALMFQQTVVSVSQSQSDQSSDSTRWGETSIQEEKEHDATASDQEDNDEEGNDTTEESQGKEENICEEANANKDFAEIVKTINNLPNDHCIWGYLDPTKAFYAMKNNAETENNENRERTDFINWYDGQLHNMAEIKAIQYIMENYEERTVETRSNNANPEDWSTEELKPALETEKDKQEIGIKEPSIRATQPKPLTQLSPEGVQNEPVEETANLEREEEGSSSTVPGWGRIESSKERERMEDLRR